MNSGNALEPFMSKLIMLCNATNATMLFESKTPPYKDIKAGELPFMRFIICDEHGEVLVSRGTTCDIVAACELTLYAYQEYVLENHIPMNIPVDLGGQSK